MSSVWHDLSSARPAVADAGGHLLRAQHDDGTVDLISTNFHSPPDTAFVLEPVTAAPTILRRTPWAALRAFSGQLDAFMVKAGEALVVGGVHTPNHRRVVAAALARVNALHPNRRYVARVDEWLAETVDIDPDGQFTEKSTSVYSPVVDRALLTIASRLDRPALRDPVRKNLEMTLYYVHPDGEVVTEASRRQDRYQRGSGQHVLRQGTVRGRRAGDQRQPVSSAAAPTRNDDSGTVRRRVRVHVEASISPFAESGGGYVQHIVALNGYFRCAGSDLFEGRPRLIVTFAAT